MVITLVFLAPDTLEYSHDLHAKNNAPFIRSAICIESLSFLMKRCFSSMGVTAFCVFSRGSDRLKALIMFDR